MHNQVKLLLYDYKLVGTTMGTHTAVQINEHEYWFSITGLKKRNRQTGTVFQFNESRRKWEQRIESGSSTSMLSFDYLNHLTSSGASGLRRRIFIIVDYFIVNNFDI